MEQKMRRFLILVLSLVITTLSKPCTTAVISGKFTKDGRPLLFKHRDTHFFQNKIRFFDDGKYDYLGLINSEDAAGKEVWTGLNSEGFAIMNSASYNLKSLTDTTRVQDKEGEIMKLALMNCATVNDFEELLRDLPKPLGVEANFGVIDAYGGAAYFEVNNFSINKIDVNDSTIAPFGYVIRTNFSFTGRKDEGKGYIRYLTAEELLDKASETNDLDFKFLLQDVSRSLKHSLLNVDLSLNPPSEKENKFVVLEDFIPRYSSVSTVVVQGVRHGESPALSTMWTILGFQLTSVAVPLWVNTKETLPRLLTAADSSNAPLCEMALKLKAKCFPISRGSGKKYMLLSKVVNKEQTGFLQLLRTVENKIITNGISLLEKWRKKNAFSVKEAVEFYKFVDSYVSAKYEKLFGLKAFPQ
jgi:hypothetical protein